MNLLEKDGLLLCVYQNSPIIIDEKVLYNIFGKKAVKEYVFIRNISIDNREGLMDLFGHFNHFNNY